MRLPNEVKHTCTTVHIERVPGFGSAVASTSTEPDAATSAMRPEVEAS